MQSHSVNPGSKLIKLKPVTGRASCFFAVLWCFFARGKFRFSVNQTERILDNFLNNYTEVKSTFQQEVLKQYGNWSDDSGLCLIPDLVQYY